MPDPRDPEAGVLAALARLGAEYRRIEIDPAFADTAAFCERYGFRPDESANTLATTRPDVNHVLQLAPDVLRRLPNTTVVAGLAQVRA